MQDATTGSCACGAVSYSYTGAFVGSCICHCTICQKSHASAFGAYAYFDEPSQFELLSGSDDLATFEAIPGSGFRCFCRKCGSTVAYQMGGQMIALTLGTVDSDSPVRPPMHVYVQSRCSWYDIADDLPQHAELPDDFLSHSPDTALR